MPKKKKIKKNNQANDKADFEIIDELNDKDFFDDCPICQTLKNSKQEKRSPTISEMKTAFKKAKEQGAITGGKWLEEAGADAEKEEEDRPLSEIEYDILRTIGEAGEEGFKVPIIPNDEMPKWMECTWRRVPCGKDECPICGKINRRRQRHIEQRENPDDPKAVFEDVGAELAEMLALIAKDAEQMGIDIENLEEMQEPPKEKEFPLCEEVERWTKDLHTIAEKSAQRNASWLFTEEAADLLWYADIFRAKTYRQLCNRWHIEKQDGYGKFDYKYTSYVLRETTDIISRALTKLNDVYEGRFNFINRRFTNLKQKVLAV